MQPIPPAAPERRIKVVISCVWSTNGPNQQDCEDRYELTVAKSSWEAACVHLLRPRQLPSDAHAFLIRLACAEDPELAAAIRKDREEALAGGIKLGVDIVTDTHVNPWFEARRGCVANLGLHGKRRRYVSNEPVYFARLNFRGDSTLDGDRMDDYRGYKQEKTNMCGSVKYKSSPGERSPEVLDDNKDVESGTEEEEDGKYAFEDAILGKKSVCG